MQVVTMLNDLYLMFDTTLAKFNVYKVSLCHTTNLISACRCRQSFKGYCSNLFASLARSLIFFTGWSDCCCRLSPLSCKKLCRYRVSLTFQFRILNWSYENKYWTWRLNCSVGSLIRSVTCIDEPAKKQPFKAWIENKLSHAHLSFPTMYIAYSVTCYTSNVTSCQTIGGYRGRREPATFSTFQKYFILTT